MHGLCRNAATPKRTNERTNERDVTRSAVVRTPEGHRGLRPRCETISVSEDCICLGSGGRKHSVTVAHVMNIVRL